MNHRDGTVCGGSSGSRGRRIRELREDEGTVGSASTSVAGLQEVNGRARGIANEMWNEGNGRNDVRRNNSHEK